MVKYKKLKIKACPLKGTLVPTILSKKEKGISILSKPRSILSKIGFKKKN